MGEFKEVGMVVVKKVTIIVKIIAIKEKNLFSHWDNMKGALRIRS